MVPDSTLLEAYQSGHIQAFETLYRRYRNGLFSYILGRIGDRYAAEEILQDVMLAFCRRSHALDLDGSIKSYLFTAARNRMVDYVRKKRPASLDPTVQAERQVDGRDGPVDSLLEAERQRLVQRAVAQLPDEQRDVVLLKLHGDLTFREIAEMTETPQGTVASRYRLALEKIRAALSDQMNPETNART